MYVGNQEGNEEGEVIVASNLNIAGGLVGLGGEITWPRATRPGDVLRLEGEILEIRRSRSKPEQGIVTVRTTLLNQNDEAAQIFTCKILVPSRPSSNSSALPRD